jgi:hypothetical protein
MFAAALAGVALPASAADNGFYLGGAIGQSSIQAGELTDEEFDVHATGYKVFAGGRFLTFLGVEGSYVDFGDIEDDTFQGVETEVTGASLQGVVYLPLGIADVFAKGGVFQQSDFVISGVAESSDDETAPVYGGVQFRIRSFALRAEVEYYDLDAIDELYMISVGASYTF